MRGRISQTVYPEIITNSENQYSSLSLIWIEVISEIFYSLLELAYPGILASFSHQKLDRQRGCLTAVLSAPCAGGIWPTFWLLPSKPFAWPNDGEVDIFESWNRDTKVFLYFSFIHWLFAAKSRTDTFFRKGSFH